MPNKNKFFFRSFFASSFEGLFKSVFKKKSKGSRHEMVEIKVFLPFLLADGSGSVQNNEGL
jgi:hypothetical protein